MFSAGQALVEVLVAELAQRLAAALLLFAEDADLEPGGLAELDEALRDLDVALVEGGVAADEVEDVDFGVLGQGLHPQLLRPVAAGREGHPQRIAVDLGVLGGGHHLLAGELPLHQHQVAAHLDDLGDVLDGRRADLLAGAAGGAAPQGVLAAGVDEIRFGGLEGDLLQLVDDLHRRQGLVGGVGRAAVLAALATRAGVAVEEVLPGQVGDPGGAEALAAFRPRDRG